MVFIPCKFDNLFAALDQQMHNIFPKKFMPYRTEYS